MSHNNNSSPITPLGFLVALISIIEITITVAFVSANDTIKWYLLGFIVGFPILLLISGLFLVLKMPYIIYPPTESTGHGEYVNTWLRAEIIRNYAKNANEKILRELVNLLSPSDIQNVLPKVEKAIEKASLHIDVLANFNEGFITIDARPILGGEEEVENVWYYFYHEYAYISEFIKQIEYQLRFKLQNSAYGVSWHFFNEQTGYGLNESIAALRNEWKATTIAMVGIDSNTILKIMPLEDNPTDS